MSTGGGTRARGLVALVASGLLLDGSAAWARTDTLPPARAVVAGPRDVGLFPGATVARDFDHLAALVGDPHGPRDIALGPQVYRGDLVIKRPLAIHGSKGAVVEGSGSATVLTVEASDVLLEDVTLRHSGRRHTREDAGVKATGSGVRIVNVRVEDALFGISLQECKRCMVQGASVVGTDDDPELRGDGIKLWESHESVVRECLVERARDLVVWYTRHALLEGNTVRFGRYGTHFMYANDATVRRSHLEGNVVGIFVMYSRRMLLEGNVLAGARGAAGMGLGFKDSDAVTARGNWLVANTAGVYLDNTPRTPEEPVTFQGNVMALNDVALRLHGSEAGLSLSGNELRQNAVMVEVDGGGTALAASLRGNHYSDYEGYDLDGNGVGDVPYEVKALSRELTDARPALKFFYGTSALGLMDAVAHAVPVLESKTLVRDAAPLVRAPEIALP